MSHEAKNLNKERQDMNKQPAKKIAAKNKAAKKVAPKKKTAPAKKSAAKKADPVKRAYNKVESSDESSDDEEENGIDFDTYEDKAIEVIEDVSEKVVAEFVKNRKGFIRKLFFWIKK